jgi:hypothetical protein
MCCWFLSCRPDVHGMHSNMKHMWPAVLDMPLPGRPTGSRLWLSALAAFGATLARIERNRRARPKAEERLAASSVAVRRARRFAVATCKLTPISSEIFQAWCGLPSLWRW